MSNIVPLKDTVDRAKQQIVPLLPRGQEQWPAFAVALNAAVIKNPKLRTAIGSNPDSAILALVKCARLGLSLNPADEHFDLIPYLGRDPKVEGQVRGRGLQYLMMNSGRCDWIHYDVIYRQELDSGVLVDPISQRVNHVADVLQRDDWKDSDIVGAYAMAQIKGQLRYATVVLSRKEIDKRRAMGMGTTNPDSPWVKHFPAMCCQKALKALGRSGKVPLAKEVAHEFNEEEESATPAEVVRQIPPTEVTPQWADALDWEVDSAARYLFKCREKDPMPGDQQVYDEHIEALKLLCEERGVEMPEIEGGKKWQDIEAMIDKLRNLP